MVTELSRCQNTFVDCSKNDSLIIKNNVLCDYLQGLDALRDDLSVMELIVYDCNYGDSLSFKALRGMDDLERLKVIMSQVYLIREVASH